MCRKFPNSSMPTILPRFKEPANMEKISQKKKNTPSQSSVSERFPKVQYGKPTAWLQVCTVWCSSWTDLLRILRVWWSKMSDIGSSWYEVETVNCARKDYWQENTCDAPPPNKLLINCAGQSNPFEWPLKKKLCGNSRNVHIDPDRFRRSCHLPVSRHGQLSPQWHFVKVAAILWLKLPANTLPRVVVQDTTLH